jgi:hypothetical protein
MSLGIRISKRGKVRVPAHLFPAPNEPLLFLYPPWIRTLASYSTAKPDQDATEDRSSLATDATLKQNNNSSSELTTLNAVPYVYFCNLANAASRPKDRSGSSRTKTDLGRRRSIIKFYKPKPGTSGSPGSQSALIRKIFHNHAAHEYVRQDGYMATAESARKDSSTGQPITEWKLRKIHESIEKAEQSAESRRDIRQAYQAYRRRKTGSWVPDWRVILADLAMNTQANGKWLNDAVKITVPEDFQGKLVAGVDDNIWNIADKYNCSVKFTRRDPKTGNYHEFLLSGSALSIGKVVTDVLRVSPTVEITRHESTKPPVSLETASSKNLFASIRLRNVRSEIRKFSIMHAEKVPRPAEWTIDTFAEYVRHLTCMEVPNHVHRVLYKGKNSVHIQVVVKVLRRVFADPESVPFFSRAAFHLAIGYCIKKNQIRDARALFVRMDLTGIEMETETFNILLRGAAKFEDLHNFHFILHLMLQRGLSPNDQTWVAYMSLIHDYRIKSYVLALMREKKLLQHVSTIKAVCEQLVDQEINTSLDQNQSEEEFLKHMDSRYGRDWFTITAGNRVIYTLGARGLISRCVEFLNTMDARFIQPDSVSINTILNHCKDRNNVIGAIEVMANLPERLGIIASEMNYETLFKTCFEARMYNLVKVVWRYACTTAKTTRRMRSRVYTSLCMYMAHSPWEKDQSLKSIFLRDAGMVIMGSKIEHFDTRLQAPPSFQSTGSSISRRTWIKNFVKEQMVPEQTFSQYWSAVLPFEDMLMKAWLLDQQWKRPEMADKVKTLQWKLENSIDIPVRPRWSITGHLAKNQADYELVEGDLSGDLTAVLNSQQQSDRKGSGDQNLEDTSPEPQSVKIRRVEGKGLRGSKQKEFLRLFV